MKIEKMNQKFTLNEDYLDDMDVDEMAIYNGLRKNHFTDTGADSLIKAKRLGLDDYYDAYIGVYTFTPDEYQQNKSKIAQLLNNDVSCGVILAHNQEDENGDLVDYYYVVSDDSFDAFSDNYSEQQVIIYPKSYWTTKNESLRKGVKKTMTEEYDRLVENDFLNRQKMSRLEAYRKYACLEEGVAINKDDIDEQSARKAAVMCGCSLESLMEDLIY